MKVLVVSNDEMFGRAISIEIAESGYLSDFSKKIEGGYDIYIIDEDSVSSSKINMPKVTFSRVDGQAHLVRPFLIENLLEAIKKASEKQDGEFDKNRYEHIQLTEKERKLLDLLLDHRGCAVSVDEISRVVWEKEVNSNIVNVYIRYLREKLEGDSDRRIIFTVRGKGYKIE